MTSDPIRSLSKQDSMALVGTAQMEQAAPASRPLFFFGPHNTYYALPILPYSLPCVPSPSIPVSNLFYLPSAGLLSAQS